MNVYMIGTVYLEDTLSTFSYLIALIAFSLAVVDGTNIVERLFGIDAGLKNGWGVLAGAYAGGRMVAGLGKGISNMGKYDSDNKNKSMSATSGGAKGEKAQSPNDTEKESDKDKKKDGTGVGVANASDSLNENDKNDAAAIPVISQQVEESSSGQSKQTKAPSPNDRDRATHSLNDTSNLSTSNGSDCAERTQSVQQSTRQTSPDTISVADQIQGNPSISNVNSSGTSSPTNVQNGINNVPTSNGSHSVERAHGVQQSTVQTDSDITSVTDQTQGNSSVCNVNSGGAPSPSTTGQSNIPANTINSPNTNGASIIQIAQGVQQSNVETDTELINEVNHTERISEKKGNALSVRLRPSSYSIPNKFSTNQNRNK